MGTTCLPTCSLLASLEILVLAAPVVGLSAQSRSELRPGTRVQVTTGGALRTLVVGSVVGLDSASIRLRVRAVRRGRGAADSEVVTVPRGSIQQVEVSLGRHANLVRGARSGALVGATTYTLLALLASGSSGAYVTVNPGAAFLAGAASGVVIGALLGAASSRERWRRVQLDPVEMGVLPGPNRL
jgi:hypothetical protein